MEIDEAIVVAVESELRRVFAHSVAVTDEEWRRDAEAVAAVAVAAADAARAYPPAQLE